MTLIFLSENSLQSDRQAHATLPTLGVKCKCGKHRLSVRIGAGDGWQLVEIPGKNELPIVR